MGQAELVIHAARLPPSNISRPPPFSLTAVQKARRRSGMACCNRAAKGQNIADTGGMPQKSRKARVDTSISLDSVLVNESIGRVVAV